MTDASHTPGPWAVSQPSGNYIDTPTGSVAALTYGATKADAHLIAAAPDLLAALGAAAEQLRTLLDESLEEDYSVLTSAETAIAKAKGADA